ncbi:MAG: hypothetical protein Q9167_002855 [Letrouitia subvulpina]
MSLKCVSQAQGAKHDWVMLDAAKTIIPLPRERILYTSPPRTTLSLQTPNSYPGKEPLAIHSSSGTAFVTTQRLKEPQLVYLPTAPTEQLQSFSAPILNLQDTHVDAPFFGANSWAGILKPVTGGGISAQHAYVKLSMTFKEGGAFDLANMYERVKETLSQAVEVARESGRSQRADLSDVTLEQLPAYEETEVASQRPTVPIQQPTPTPTPTKAAADPTQRDTSAVSSSDDEQIPESRDTATSNARMQLPNEPPPGYDESQQSSVVHTLEQSVRRLEGRPFN